MEDNQDCPLKDMWSKLSKGSRDTLAEEARKVTEYVETGTGVYFSVELLDAGIILMGTPGHELTRFGKSMVRAYINGEFE